MSDNWIVLVPEDPNFVPVPKKQMAARKRLTEIAPNADEVKVETIDTIEFFDCGANFQRVLCPSCQSEIPIDWWQERMCEDYEPGFKLASYITPCCGATSTLHGLVYDWPQTFGRFSLEAMNPNIGKLDDKYKRELEEILGTKLIVVYQHL